MDDRGQRRTAWLRVCKRARAATVGAVAGIALVSGSLLSPQPVLAIDEINTPVTGAAVFFPSLELDGSGNPAVAYYNPSAGDLSVLHCNDPACAPGGDSITSPDTAASVDWNVSMVLDGSGNPVVAYDSSSAIKVLRCNDANCASGGDTVNVVAATGHDPSLALDSNGYPVIAYRDASQSIALAHCNDVGCAGSNESIATVEAGSFVGGGLRFTSIVLDASGFPVISYVDDSPDDLKLAHCNDANCSGGNESIVTLDTSFVDADSSLALDSDGFPVVAYRPGTFDLGIVHCNDVNCQGGNESVTVPDSVNDTGSYATLVLDAAGFPVIAHHDSTTTSLRVTHCNDENCAGGDESLETPDSDDIVGYWPSLALDAGGLPVVAYTDWTNGRLKLLHCDDADCAPAPTPATYTVNNTGDGGDSNTADNICNNGSGQCTFRAALEQANANGGVDTINFAIGSGLITISPVSALPTVSNPVDIDGRTQPGYVVGGGPLIEIRGDSAGAGVDGLVVTAGNSSVRGLVINRFDGDGLRLETLGGNTVQTNHFGTGFFSGDDFGNAGNGLVVDNSPNNLIGGPAALDADYNIMSGNVGNGILITGAGSTGNTVRTNAIGTNGGLTLIDVGNDGSGLVIDGASNNTAFLNVISGNATHGVEIKNGATGNTIRANAIGTDRNGTVDLGNDEDGVYVFSANYNSIGLSSALLQGNLISGNDGIGVELTGSSTGNSVRGNGIGLTLTGASAIGNGGPGVELGSSADGNTVGGDVLGQGNVISGNGYGVWIATEDIRVQGNIVGLDRTGSAAVPNLNQGVVVGGSDALIGGHTPATRNVISGNASHGVLVDTDLATVRITGNYIGTNIFGQADLGNGGNGVFVSDDTQSVRIGGTAPGERNVISGNAGSGVRVQDSSNAHIEGNLIGLSANGLVAIGNDDAGIDVEGPSGLQIGGSLPGQGNVIAHNGEEAVRVTDAFTSGTTVRGNNHFNNGDSPLSISGGAPEPTPPAIAGLSDGLLTGTVASCSGCVIDIYSDDDDEARTYQGSTVESSGAWAFTGSVIGPKVRATVTDGSGNTSEFSAVFDVLITELAGSAGSPGFYGDGGPAGQALVDTPRGMYEHTDGVIYFADSDNNRVRSIGTDVDRKINTVAGSGTPPACPGALGDGGAATSAGLCHPRDVYVHANGDLYIADTDNCRIRKVSGGTISTVAGTTCGFSGDGGLATLAKLDSPRGIALDAAGNLYIADTNNNRIRRVETLSGMIHTIAGTGSTGSGGDLGLATQAELDHPHDVYVALGNHLIIADTENHKLRRVYLPNGIITTFAGSGVAGFSGDGGPALWAQLNGPEAIAADAEGGVSIADTQNNRIRRVTFMPAPWVSGQTIVTVAGIGSDGSTGMGGPALQVELNKPAGIAIGSENVSDTGNNRNAEIETSHDPNGQPGGSVRPVTSCTSGSIANGDAVLLLFVPGIVLFRRRLGRMLIALGAMLRWPVRGWA